MPTANELGSKITAEQGSFAKWMNDHKAADGSYDLSGDNLTEFNKRNDAIGELIKQRDVQVAAEKTAADLAPTGRATVKADDAPEFKDDDEVTTKAHVAAAFKSAFAKNAETIKALSKGYRGSVSFDLNTNLKTLLQTTVHAPQADRQQTTDSALYFGNVEDVFPHGSTNSKSIDYFIQTTDTDNAAAVAQGSAVTDSAFAWTLTTDPVEVVQTWIPITREAVDDIVGLQSLVTGMLAKRLQKKSNNLILAGDGSTPNPTGVTIRTGFQTQALGSDTRFDAIHKAITLVNVTGDANANAIFLHPSDWEQFVLERTGDGLYILGNPAGMETRRLWGLPVYLTSGIGSAGTGAVIDTSYHEVVERQGISVEMSTEHSTYFTERKIALMLFRRFAVASYRPSATCTVTGI